MHAANMKVTFLTAEQHCLFSINEVILLSGRGKELFAHCYELTIVAWTITFTLSCHYWWCVARKLFIGGVERQKR